MYYVLFNPLACSGTGEASAQKIKEFIKEEIEFTDITKVDYKEFFGKLTADDKVILCGGDGTLNRFVNDTEGILKDEEILFFSAGTGNDFINDLGKKAPHEPFDVRKYIKDLPTVEVKGNSYKFVNGVGYGIDGYCCEVGDQLRAQSDKPVNYAGIAIKGLLGKFKPVNAKVTVDGNTYEYKKVWLAPTMNGRFYGGGMNIAPGQDRLNEERKISTVIFHGSGKIKTLVIFPNIFKGTHVKHTKNITVLTGYDVTVEFDRPTALQVDGETILAVSSYRATSSKIVK